MNIKFNKMHGLGNDFMVIDAINQQITLSAEQIRQLGDRHFGVGFDQLLLVEPPRDVGAEFQYRIFNCDGYEVEQCGNGARCFARFVTDKGLTKSKDIVVDTNSGRISLRLQENDQVTVDMGRPVFEPEHIPLCHALSDRYEVTINQSLITFGAVSMGNPHAVIQVDDVANAPLEEIGPLLEQHAMFPKRANIGFMQVLSRDKIKLRVYERGVGETQACGSGACAAVAVGQKWELLNDSVGVMLTGGELTITCSGAGTSILMTGPATSVYEGFISI